MQKKATLKNYFKAIPEVASQGDAREGEILLLPRNSTTPVWTDIRFWQSGLGIGNTEC